MKKLSLTAGTALSAIGLWLAVGLAHPHFYDVLLVGLLCLLVPFASNDFWHWRSIARTYILFIAAGLVVDLALALTIFNFWHYAYTSIFEYLVLYLWIYPAGGFVTLLGYLILRERLGITQEPPHPRRALVVTLIASLILAATILFTSVWWQFLALLTLFGALTALLTEYLGKPSSLSDIFGAPLRTIGALLVVSLANLLVHEYPNTFAYAWTYTPPALGIFSELILGVPLCIWLAWPALVIGPVSLWYFARSRSAR